MNVDEQREVASRYRIMSIPTMFLFKDGDLVDQNHGRDAELRVRSETADRAAPRGIRPGASQEDGSVGAMEQGNGGIME